MKRSVSALSSQITYGILLALSIGPSHGYGLMKQLEADSGGYIRIGPGALYTNLKQLNQTDFIEEMPFEGDPRRRYYRLTKKGWDRLAAEAIYYKRLAKLIKERKV